MSWSVNHYIKIGDIIKSDDEQIAIADAHEVWDAFEQKLKVVGKATITISPYAESVIYTNLYNTKGLVCFLPQEFKGCGILAVRVTRIYNKSVEAIPIDYLQNDKPLEWICHGATATTMLQQKTDYPSLRRITAKEGKRHDK